MSGLLREGLSPRLGGDEATARLIRPLGLWQAPKKATSQAEKFEQAARDLGCDDCDEKFEGVLGKLAEARNLNAHAKPSLK
ncbi:hypothetical protein Nham_3893 [Nitrobacter hamburgensis X14]|uniref:Uncharacterized protein n=1 Tax=Nitrobacter hamburgensis (strain DSM 10229 / NCIMB 13809 / X14) TaxID=323097 RepID=Q1QGR2_NITHX|nr:hypothetical protein Nham_3893 [Nitrobacter hamburgensis X14]